MYTSRSAYSMTSISLPTPSIITIIIIVALFQEKHCIIECSSGDLVGSSGGYSIQLCCEIWDWASVPNLTEGGLGLSLKSFKARFDQGCPLSLSFTDAFDKYAVPFICPQSVMLRFKQNFTQCLMFLLGWLVSMSSLCFYSFALNMYSIFWNLILKE